MEVEDSEQFIAELTKRSQSLNESVAMRNILGTLEIQFCPQCLQPLKAAHQEQSCKLCGQQLQTDASASQRLRLQQELAMQIRESSALLDGKRIKLQQLQGRLPGVRRAAEQAERQLKEALSKVTLNETGNWMSFTKREVRLRARLDTSSNSTRLPRLSPRSTKRQGV